MPQKAIKMVARGTPKKAFLDPKNVIFANSKASPHQLDLDQLELCYMLGSSLPVGASPERKLLLSA